MTLYGKGYVGSGVGNDSFLNKLNSMFLYNRYKMYMEVNSQ